MIVKAVTNINSVKHEKGIVLLIVSLIIFSIFRDIPLTLFYTQTQSIELSKLLLYISEFIILLIFIYTLFISFFKKVPVYLFIYICYIALFTGISFIFFDTYSVLRNAHKFFSVIPFLLLGYYLSSYSTAKDYCHYLKVITIFLTIISAIGIAEWFLWYFFPSSMTIFYSKLFQAGSYYQNVKHTNTASDFGVLMASLRTNRFIIPGVAKRLTGLYLEPLSAGFNAALAVILVLYQKMKGYIKSKPFIILLVINMLAVILTTSRSAYLMLFFALFIFIFISKNKISKIVSFFILTLPFLYRPFRIFCINSVKNLGGGFHAQAIKLFFNAFRENVFSFQGIFGDGVGSKWLGHNLIYAESGYGMIFGQLGLFGVIAVILFFLTIVTHIHYSRENKFLVLSIMVPTFILLFFGSYPFGYKTFGFIYLILGMLMGDSGELKEIK
jgi:hypothetical protein